MKFFRATKRVLILAGLVALTGLMVGCTASRYRLKMHMKIDSLDKAVKIEASEYLLNTQLGNAYSENRILPGPHGTIVITTGVRGQTIDVGTKELLDYDEYLRCRIYIQTELPPKVGELRLKGNSFVQVLGRFEQGLADKIFIADTGLLVVDSIVSDQMFATLNGYYLNGKELPLAYNGKFKLKIAD